jgi:hypothetical protein
MNRRSVGGLEMPYINYIKENNSFVTFASQNGLSGSERELWHALFYFMNARAQRAVFPEGFISISNKQMLSILSYNEDTLIKARNRLKQRGLIDYRPGVRNTIAPMYQMIYLTAAIDSDDCYPTESGNIDAYPNKSGNLYGNMGGNLSGNMGGNMGGKNGDLYQTINVNVTQPNVHTRTERAGVPARACAMARSDDGEFMGFMPCQDCVKRKSGLCKNGYIGGKEGAEYVAPRRYDRAYETSDTARKAVAQRILNAYGGDLSRGRNIHELLCFVLESGVIPEFIEDAISECHSEKELNAVMGESIRRAKDICDCLPDKSSEGDNTAFVCEAISRMKN